ncbi:MAG: penicillin acylase family protein, partial [Gemmatimonadetes bacterium]|nr:penicillin acylase family protein [Gemmatimonadota bacterium]
MRFGPLAAIVPLVVLLAGSRPGPPSVPAESAEILWDEWGVPHVYADDEAALFRGFGWAMAEAHGDLLLGLYAIARGRAAEYWGGEARVASDRWVRTLGIPARAAAWHAALEPDERRFLDAFADGINAWARTHPGAVADSVAIALPVTGADVLAHAQRILHFGFLLAPWDAAGRLNGSSAAGGSNGWAIGPGKAAGDHAMLLINPHLPWRGEYTWFEAHLVGPGIDFSGATLVGMPFLAVGFNDRLGWTHTVNLMDGADVFALEPVEGGYRWGGDVRAFDVRTDTVRIRRDDGTVHAEPLVVR